MKSRLLVLISFILFFNCSSFGQFDSLLKPGKKWYYKQFNGEYLSPRKILEVPQNQVSYNSLMYYPLVSDRNDSFLIREDKGKVYSVMLGNTLLSHKEILMYDFNLQVNDTFKFLTFGRINMFFDYEDTTVIETYVVTKTYTNNNRKYIELQNTLKYMLRPIWVEGIGCLNSYLFYTFSRTDFNPFESNTTLIQACDGKLKIYPNDNLSCNENILSVNTYQNQFKLYPNPAINSFNISVPTTEKFTIMIIDNLGRNVSEIKLNGSTEYQIPISFPKGLYIIRIQNYNTIYKSERLLIE